LKLAECEESTISPVRG